MNQGGTAKHQALAPGMGRELFYFSPGAVLTRRGGGRVESDLVELNGIDAALTCFNIIIDRPLLGGWH